MEQAGYAVVVAADPAEAAERLCRDPLPALVLFDTYFPHNEGTVGWFFRWREQLSGPRTPVVVLTGLEGTAAVWTASLGADGCLQKPLNVDRLLEEVRRHLAG